MVLESIAGVSWLVLIGLSKVSNGEFYQSFLLIMWLIILRGNYKLMYVSFKGIQETFQKTGILIAPKILLSLLTRVYNWCKSGDKKVIT